MPVQTFSEAVDNLYVTTWQNMKEAAVDNIYDATPFWFWMRANGKIKHVTGGRFITEPLRYAKHDNITWLGKGGTVSLQDKEFLSAGRFDWRYVAAAVVRFGVDDQQNVGKNQIMNLMNAKLDNAKEGLISEMEKVLAQGAGGVASGFDGLQWLVADDPTAAANTVGSIDPSVNTWWQNKTKNMTGLSFAVNGVAEMRTMLNNTMNNLNQDRPDIIISGQTPFEYYEDAVLEFYRIQNNKLADAGFMNQTFKGIPMVWTPSIANTRMYFLNTKFLYLDTDPRMEFDMTEWKLIPDQVNDRAAQIVLAGQFVTSRRRCQGVLFNVDTP